MDSTADSNKKIDDLQDPFDPLEGIRKTLAALPGKPFNPTGIMLRAWGLGLSVNPKP